MINKDFYDKNRDNTYAHEINNKKPEEFAWYSMLQNFLNNYSLRDKKWLEIGSARGLLQDTVEDYTGVDIAESTKVYYHKPYYVATKEQYPFENESFDVIWTFDVFEHIPHLQIAMEEIKRILNSGGVVLFKPAWQCRSWAADGYEVRPYSDFNFTGKIIKSIIPLRDSFIYRALKLFPKRLYRHMLFLLGHKFKLIKYKKITPNWEILWTSDSDACNSIDPHDAILWFESNGFKCLNLSTNKEKLFFKTGELIFQKVSKWQLISYKI